jgi:outer membrane protein TolC
VTEDEDPEFRQDLSFSATWTQPLFVNRRIIDLRVFGASIELAGGIPLRLARTGAEIQKNSRIVSVVETYLQVVQLRKQLEVLNRNVETTGERVEQSRIRRRQGTARQRDVWDVEIRLDELRETRLETEYALLQAESSLAASLGIDGELGDQELGDAVPTLTLPGEEELIQAARSSSGQVRRARESLSQARMQRIVNGRQYGASLSTSFSLSPSYADDWSEGFGTNDFGESYSELFAEDASWDTRLAVSLQVPIYNGGQARSRAEQDTRAIEKASLRLSDVQRSVEDQIDALYLRRRLLEDQLSLRERSLDLEEERLEESRRLAELDSLTELELREAETQVQSKENALWRTRADLFLNGLRILQTAGRDLEAVVEAGADENENGNERE